jgi:hypothetical protein
VTGPEHYAEGNRLLAVAAERDATHDRMFGEIYQSDPANELLIGRARAHFAAAQAAALASALHPTSITWQTALGLLEPKETP